MVTPREAPALVYFKDSIYVLGGKHDLKSCERLCFKCKEWNEMPENGLLTVWAQCMLSVKSRVHIRFRGISYRDEWEDV